MKCNAKIAILMSCYNGASYIKEQIDSIVSQSFTQWELFIRDDGSTDDTIKIINQYQKKDSRIFLYKDNLGNIRTRASFMTLLENVDSQLYAFADQDDVWLPEKLSLAYSQIINCKEPVLYHSNVVVVDQELNVICNDYWNYVHIHPSKRFTPFKLIVNPSVIGMTMVFNKAARNYMIPFKGINMMHDSWCSIQACLNGRIINDSTPTVMYRQHLKNVCGLSFTKDKKMNFFDKIRHVTLVNIEKYKNVNSVYGISLFRYIYVKILLKIDNFFF